MRAHAAPEIEVFYDGGCPLCRREVALLRRLDRRGRVRFVDIDAPGFEAAAIDAPGDLMARIHARGPDGAWVTGVEVFRQIYALLGFGPLVALTRLPGLSPLLDALYAIFARNRVRWLGRCSAGACAVA
jgi:predicted DCC family thiol-disulfide oxidoreductase YuxK